MASPLVLGFWTASLWITLSPTHPFSPFPISPPPPQDMRMKTQKIRSPFEHMQEFPEGCKCKECPRLPDLIQVEKKNQKLRRNYHLYCDRLNLIWFCPFWKTCMSMVLTMGGVGGKGCKNFALRKPLFQPLVSECLWLQLQWRKMHSPILKPLRTTVTNLKLANQKGFQHMQECANQKVIIKERKKV